MMSVKVAAGMGLGDLNKPTALKPLMIAILIFSPVRSVPEDKVQSAVGWDSRI